MSGSGVEICENIGQERDTFITSQDILEEDTLEVGLLTGLLSSFGNSGLHGNEPPENDKKNTVSIICDEIVYYSNN